jgi:hypothetical protein
VHCPVSIPEDVLIQLRADKIVRNVLENENVSPENLPPSWFSAAIVRLSSSIHNDLVIVGNPPVSGGNSAMFWVFADHGGGKHTLVLSTAAHDLIIKQSRYKAYKDIELRAMTATEVSSVLYRFNGRAYERARAASHHLGS